MLLGDSNTNNLIAFKDNGAGVDLYDSNIKYNDADGDGDYYETYVAGGRTCWTSPSLGLGARKRARTARAVRLGEVEGRGPAFTVRNGPVPVTIGPWCESILNGSKPSSCSA